MSKQLDRAHQKGRDAALQHKPQESNPYADHRNDSGSITWSRAFRRAWQAGWREAYGEMVGLSAPQQK